MDNPHDGYRPDISQLAPIYQQAVSALKPAIDKLLQHYQHWYNRDIIDADDQPDVALRKFVSEFDHHCPPSMSLSRLKIALRTVITQLECFRYRTIACSRDGKIIDVWQPLAETFDEFCTRHRSRQHHIRQHGIVEDPYPPVDLVISWVDSVLREHGESVYQNAGPAGIA